MNEYITLEQAAKAFSLQTIHSHGDCMQMLIDAVSKGWIAPAADVAEVRHGRWIFEPGKIPYCSECKEYSDDGDKGATFCPWCGVRMDKEDEHD